MKQVEVQIMGQSYLLGAPEGGESRLLEAVERLDTAMSRIRDAGKIKARDRIAVLAALNFAFELSDREHSALAAARVPAQAAQAAPAGSEGERLQALVSRLDDALGHDGRLL